MSSEPLNTTTQAFETLRQLARRQPRNVEYCDLCRVAVRSEHPHLLELPQRRLLCACGACTLLFSGRSDAESLLPLETWKGIVQANPILRVMQPDVEALLVNRVGHAREASAAEYYIAPIDACYQLVGLIRVHWHGLSGGEEVWREIGNFFADLRAKAECVTEANYA